MQYFDDEERYADLINGYVFHGRQIVSAKDVIEMDSRKTGEHRRRGRRGKKKYRERYRDTVRKMIFGLNFVIIGIENQSLTHYAMPIRVMSYNAMEYEGQLKRIQRNHRKMKDLKNRAEYLGLFSRGDKVPPAFTLVVYYGQEPWDGARDLYEILNFADVPEELKSLVNHYPIHILEVRQFKNTDLFRTDLREVFEFVQCSNDKKKMEEFVELRKKELSDMAEDACDLIAAVTGTERFAFKEEAYRNEGGTINMCKGMLDWLKEKEQKGREEGVLACSMNAALKLFQRGMNAEEISSVFEIHIDIARKWYDDWKVSTC